ncbi:ECF-type sigma factor [Marinicella sp. S1101]|uniref:ECF-type sigma factor n=1 Tax=Marinicella marina TaxID=2996016 RepID=UPI002260C095|nr:ECF-type sigma factor [Marinicella marina]MCX7552542.1 ECF-type sigma factor [Marinicella marina]MDJ1139418.1 ECF-type sigma factor [Marinicella marina]
MKEVEITLLIEQASDGEQQALDQLIPIIYPDLKMIAAGIRRKQFNANETLNTTSLVNEAWLKLRKYGVQATSRKHFFCIAAKAMRQVLMNAAKAKTTNKRQAMLSSIDDIQIKNTESADWLLKLDEVINAVAHHNKRTEEVFHLKYFLGLSNAEIADLMAVDIRTIKRDWTGVKTVIKQVLG